MQVQALAEYPEGPPDSERVYVPALKVAPLTTSAELVAPGPDKVPAAPPLAIRVQFDSDAVPPLSLIKILSSVSEGAVSLLVIVHVALPPFGIETFEQLL